MNTFTYAVPVTLKSYDITTAATALVEINFKILSFVEKNIAKNSQDEALANFTSEIAMENLKHFSDEDGLKVRLLAAEMMDKMMDAILKDKISKRKRAKL